MKHTILVVDDNPSNLRLFTFLLANPNYELLTARSAEQALQILEGVKPRLILMDVQLPDIDGLTLTRRLKQDARLRDTAIVAVTASAMKGDEEKALSAGVDGYMTKPLQKDVFRAMVERYLKQEDG
jgi:CheY-like chemotaxis protein